MVSSVALGGGFEDDFFEPIFYDIVLVYCLWFSFVV